MKNVEKNKTETFELKGAAKEIVGYFRNCKRDEQPLMEQYGLEPTDKLAGLNIRKSNLTDCGAVERVFRPLTFPARKPLDKVCFDEKRNAIVATDGVMMLFCNIPEGFKPDGRFVTEGYCNWTLPMGRYQRETTPYALSDLDKVVEFGKCDDLHNILAITAASAKAYRHDDKEGYWKNLYIWVGDTMFNPDPIYTVVEALFRLGSDRIGLYKADSGLMHIVGFGNGLDARGLVCPMRYSGLDGGGAVVFPIGKGAVKAA